MIDQSSALGPLSRRTKDESEDDFKTRLLALSGDALGGGTGGSTSPAGAPVTPHVVLLGASATQVIPVGAKGWSFVVLTGTATVAGVAGIPAGVGDADVNTLAATLTITTAAASSAYLHWNT